MYFFIISYLAFTLFFSNASFGEASNCKGCNSCAPCCGAACPSGCCCCTGEDNPTGAKSTDPLLHTFLDAKNYIQKNRSLSASDINPSECANSDYELFFVGVGHHLVIVALSEYVVTDKVTNCPSNLVFHQASIYKENVVQSVKKEVLEVPEDELAQHDDRLSLGSFSLGKIFESFNNTNSEDKVYDMVANNCASLLIEMAIGLGIDPTDKSIATYAANHLVYNANSFMMDGLSQNDFRLALEDNVSVQADQYAIIEDFVKTYIDERV